MTPMIDVVFLLIIFFLVSSHLARQEARMPLDLPLAELSETDTSVEDKLTVNVTDAGKWLVGGTEVDAVRLAGLLNQHRSDHGEDAAVRVRTDRSVPYGRVEPILRAAAKSGLWNASFSVYQERN